MENEKIIILIKNSKKERDKLVKGFDNLETIRQPLESYLIYTGSLGFADYMKKHNVDLSNFKRVEEYYNCGCIGVDGEKSTLSEGVEKELALLNELHAKYKTKILDVEERIANLEAETWKAEPQSKDRTEAETKIGQKKGVIALWRKRLSENILQWHKDAIERAELRKAGKIFEKSYTNAVDELPEEPPVPKAAVDVKKCKAWLKENQPIISLGISIIMVTASLMVLHHIKTN
jgi:hypothetical protein